MSTSAPRGLERVWTARISSRPVQVRRRDVDLAVEAARAQEGRVEVLQPVRGSHDHDLVGAAEAVELDEELVQRLVVLTVVPLRPSGPCRRRRARR